MIEFEWGWRNCIKPNLCPWCDRLADGNHTHSIGELYICKKCGGQSIFDRNLILLQYSIRTLVRIAKEVEGKK